VGLSTAGDNPERNRNRRYPHRQRWATRGVVGPSGRPENLHPQGRGRGV